MRNLHFFQKCCHFRWLCFDFSKNDNTFERNEDCATAFLKWTDFSGISQLYKFSISFIDRLYNFVRFVYTLTQLTYVLLISTFVNKTSPKGFWASKCDVRNWLFSKLGTFEKLFGFFGDFLGIFVGFFWEIFWEFIRRIFLGGFLFSFFWRNFLEDFLGRNSLFTLFKSAKLFESERDWCFCQDFVSMEKEGKRNLDP